jgi:hypothetical protein
MADVTIKDLNALTVSDLTDDDIMHIKELTSDYDYKIALSELRKSMLHGDLEYRQAVMAACGGSLIPNGVKIGDQSTDTLQTIAISDDYLVIGNPSYTSNTGRVFVLKRNGAGYVGNQTYTILEASDKATGDLFGYSVDIDGDYIIVGAYAEAGGGTARGQAYVFNRTGDNVWDAGTILVKPGTRTDNDEFGRSVSINGDYVAVGAGRANTNVGDGFAFHRTGLNIWDAGVALGYSGSAGDEAGRGDGNAICIHGDYIILGAWGYDHGGSYSNGGRAYVYHRTGTNTWDGGYEIKAATPVANAQFGYAVSIYTDSGGNDYVGIGCKGCSLLLSTYSY